MYTEVGEQMAEQNILNGNQKQLEQIIGDIKEHNVKKDRLEKLAESVKDISKELDNARKEKQNEMDSKIKASTDAICDGYDKSINADKDKIKAVSAARDKAKMVGVKERINAETASLRAQNEDLADQINEAFIHENICNRYSNYTDSVCSCSSCIILIANDSTMDTFGILYGNNASEYCCYQMHF